MITASKDVREAFSIFRKAFFTSENVTVNGEQLNAMIKGCTVIIDICEKIIGETVFVKSAKGHVIRLYTALMNGSEGDTFLISDGLIKLLWMSILILSDIVENDIYEKQILERKPSPLFESGVN